MKKCILSISYGDEYKIQSSKMIQSFINHNGGYEVETFHDNQLDSILPKDLRNWSQFNKCEIGRWFAVRKLLGKYDSVLYCDNDMRWFNKMKPIVPENAQMILSPHYILNVSRKMMRNLILKDGLANLGMFEIFKGGEIACDYVIENVLPNPDIFKHKEKLWLQNLASTIRDIGAEAFYDMNPGNNVAFWNLACLEREIYESNGNLFVKMGMISTELASFHYSCIGRLQRMGGMASRMLDIL